MNADTSLMTDLMGLFGDPVVWIILAAYFAPTMIAIVRKSAAVKECVLCNVCFGWSGIGWLGAMCLAVVSPTRSQRAYQYKVQCAKDEFYLREAR